MRLGLPVGDGMFRTASYDLNQELYTSTATVVARGFRRADGCPVVVKKPSQAAPAAAAVASLRREYEILKSLDIAEVAQPIAFEVADGTAALVVEDGGEPVRVFPREGPDDITDFLRTAIAISRAVQAIHDRGVVHKDLKPQHLLRGGDGRIKIIDFGLSTRLVHEYCQWVDVDSIEGTLAYIAPEQTGRLDRAVDRRSDLYSLGVTFFEMATGQLPFDSRDPLELVHCHIAKPPPRADDVCPRVPAMVASIIEKLMAKDAEDRYQTAAGLAADLERCLAEWEPSTTIGRFRLGARDVSSILMLPQKLYGRDATLAGLYESLEAARGGQSQLVLITGPSGIGKTALVRQLHRHVLLGGHFVSGKFDALNRGEPYSAVVAACRELVRALLTTRMEDFAAKKRALMAALGANAQVIIDLVPELDLVLGAQPAVPPLGPIEAQNRFEQTFDAFLGALITKDEPLVMFLDDLQWADAASLRLVRLILTSVAGSRPLVVIGSHRSDDVFDLHPLMIEIDRIRKSAVAVSKIDLEPLGQEAIAAFVADSLSRPVADVHVLASVLHGKTHGNPFELGQYLAALHRDGLLYANPATHRWEWNLDAIRRLEVMDDVADIVLKRLRGLPAEAQRVVSLAAHIGSEFDLATMTVVSGLSTDDLLVGLETALREEILVSIDHGVQPRIGDGGAADRVRNERYLFAHDRVREGAYALVAKEERPALHLRLGRHLRQALGDAPNDEQLFAVAHQLNLGAEMILDGGERHWLAELNLRCAHKAQSKAAVAQALSYAEHALTLVGPSDYWSTDYAIACAAQIARAECEMLRGDNDRTLAILDEIDAHATSVADRVAAWNLRTLVLLHLGQPFEGCRNSVSALRLLGVDLPEPTDRETIGRCIGAEFEALQAVLATTPFEELSEMTDTKLIAQVRTLAHAIPATYQAVPPLMVLMVLKAMRLLLQHGKTEFMPFFLAQYAIAHLAITGDHVAAHRFGKLAIELGLRQRTASSLGATYFLFASFTGHWCQSYANSAELLDTGLKRCLDSGDALHAMYCLTFGIITRHLAGFALPSIRALVPPALDMVNRRGDLLNRTALVVQARLLTALAGESETPGSLNGDGFDEQRCEAELPPNHHCWLRAAEAEVRFHAGLFKETVEAATTDHANVGLAAVVDLTFYKGLAHAALARTSPGAERDGHITELTRCLARFETWAELCPANQNHRRAMIAAALAELRGDVALAIDEHETAIASAESHENLAGRALACELAGQFHLRAGRRRIARTYLSEAVAAYEAWGAVGKVDELLRTHPDIEPGSDDDDACRTTLRTSKARPSSLRRSSSPARSASVTLDIESAMRASQAIASELATDRLLDRLMRILVENAGAQRGVLVVSRNGDLFVEAERTVSPDDVRLGLRKPLASAEVPEKLIRYVARTHETLVCNNSVADSISFSDDSYFIAHPPRSALGLPLLHQGQLSAVLYLENRAIVHGFHPARLSRLQFLATQAAAALENSRLYEEVQSAKQDLERRVLDRTRELSQRNTDLRNVLDTVNQGLVTIDRYGRLTGESSAKASTWFGELREGTSWFDVLATVDRNYACEFRAFFTRLAQGESLAVLREQMPRKIVIDSRTLDVDLSPVGEDEPWTRMLVVASDMTDRERQAKLEIDLRQAQKLQAIGELAAGIAHEINTPAQFVGDSIEFLAGAFEQTLGLVREYHKAIQVCGDETLAAETRRIDEAADIEYTQENAPAALERARDGVTRIATIVRAMKEFAHPDNRQKSTADLNRALETTLTIARNEYKYVADVETHFGELPPVYCHVGDLNQVFLNLIVNSTHAIADVVGKSGAKGRITVRTFCEGPTVHIQIEDTGCGIPPEIRDRVFDPFFTTKEVGRGSGQGLAIARSIVVDKHGGRLSFESAVGKGTTFTIELPIDAPATVG